MFPVQPATMHNFPPLNARAVLNAAVLRWMLDPHACTRQPEVLWLGGGGGGGGRADDDGGGEGEDDEACGGGGEGGGEGEEDEGEGGGGGVEDKGGGGDEDNRVVLVDELELGGPENACTCGPPVLPPLVELPLPLPELLPAPLGDEDATKAVV
jgi:hypothetical protein